ncbi:MAG: GyrI-like domain-containing protein [Chloroflexi bacterium]|jgi:AraC family transcriptional regulator|nr:GyrI-like domain-containing protein [Chloroflexota bacterium]
MSELVVRIVRLEPMRVASVYGFGAEPERIAHEKLVAWAGPRGYLDDLEHHRVFGFDNPSPSPSSPNYGYELWITVEPEVEPDGDTRIVDFAGGLYAVTRVLEIGDPYQSIPTAWKQLYTWCEDSPYRFGTHQCLEEHLRTPETSGEWTLDLYMPIIE